MTMKVKGVLRWLLWGASEIWAVVKDIASSGDARLKLRQLALTLLNDVDPDAHLWYTKGWTPDGSKPPVL